MSDHREGTLMEEAGEESFFSSASVAPITSGSLSTLFTFSTTLEVMVLLRLEGLGEDVLLAPPVT
jgi:hypothetical protein